MFMVIHSNEDKKEQQALNSGVEFKLYNNKTTNVEYGSDTKAIDFVKKYKGTLKCPKIDTKKLGIQTLTYKIGVDGYTEKYTKKINVVDTKGPEIKLDVPEDQTLEQGEAFSFDEVDVHCEDPVDGKIKPVITGNIDTSKIGSQKIVIRATDKNGNTATKTISVEVQAPETSKTVFDTSTGEKLDSWSQYDSQYIIVRGRAIYLQGTVSQNLIDEYVKEINACPAYLLKMVDKIIIASQDVMTTQYNVNNTDKDTVLGHTQYADDQATVILNGTTKGDDDDVFIHETSHVYEAKLGISKMNAFKKIYKEEKDNANEYASKSASEFFAYTYSDYVTKGKDELSKSCPKAANFYEKMNI